MVLGVDSTIDPVTVVAWAMAWEDSTMAEGMRARDGSMLDWSICTTCSVWLRIVSSSSLYNVLATKARKTSAKITSTSANKTVYQNVSLKRSVIASPARRRPPYCSRST